MKKDLVEEMPPLFYFKTKNVDSQLDKKDMDQNVFFCLIIFLNKYTDVKAVNLSRVKRCPNGLHRLRASCHPCVINLEMIERLWRCHIKIPITLEGWQWLFIMAEKKVRNRGYAVRIDRVGVKRIRGNLQMSQTEQTQLNINQYKQLPLRTLSIQSV